MEDLPDRGFPAQEIAAGGRAITKVKDLAERGVGVTGEHQVMEAALRASGVPHVLLRISRRVAATPTWNSSSG